MGDVNHEPTMEEILASIKKIIAEDGEQAVSGADDVRRRKRPVLETSESPVSEPADDDVLELTDAVEPEAVAADRVPERSAPIMSDDAAEASQAAFAALSSIAKTDAGDGHPLEGLVREMLRPMLKDWLDDNLPGLVEELVAKEIARIAAGRD